MSADPRRVADVLAGFLDRPAWRERLAAGRLRAGWAEVVGAGIAAHSEPVRLAAGVLTIRAEPGAWATELSLLSTTILARAAGFAGADHVREIRVVAGTLQGRGGGHGAGG